ncbi:MAG TPA: glycine cleavage system protein GcvH, partial [Acidimicrobiaceae bacterium]|nr:glycine cleavage system protein GcvH [Acidimicrobiaceae bacterium]HCB36788.1 glycine cleavage system protein GcvH [Acidimicrobiaceae bacterium]
METPDELSYSSDHEWVRRDGDNVRVGITDFAQDALGDIVYVDMQAVGSQLVADETMGEIESTKSVTDLFAPVSGEVVEVNTALEDEPQLVNEDPYGAGWICVIEPSDPAQ